MANETKEIPEIDVPERTFYYLLHINPVSMGHQEFFQKIFVRSFERLAANIHISRKMMETRKFFLFRKVLSMYFMFENYAKL